MKKIIVFLVLCLGILPVFVEKGISQTIVEQQQRIDPFEEAIDNLKSPDPYVRRQAAEQLGNLRDPKAIPHLKKLLTDENPFVRQTAVDSLGLIRSKEVLDDILFVLSNDKEVQVRQSAVVALGYIGSTDEKVVSLLTKLLEDENESLSIKYAVCNTLSILRSTQPVSVLIDLFENTQDISLKKAVIYTLGKITHPDGITALRNSIERNVKNEELLKDIVRVLIDISDKESVEKFKLLYSTTGISLNLKFYLAYGLAKLNKDTSVLPLIKNSLKSSNEEVKNLAIDAIRFIGDKESLILLKEMQKKETSPYTKQLIELAIKQLEIKYPTQTLPQQKR